MIICMSFNSDGLDAQARKRARLARRRIQEQPYDYDKLTKATTQLKQVYTEGYVVFLNERTLIFFMAYVPTPRFLPFYRLSVRLKARNGRQGW
jgi:hypothetical protein